MRQASGPTRERAVEEHAGDGAAARRGRRIRGLDADERREQRRQDLLEAALELFASKGYANTSIEQICQTAYVGTRSFYEVFDGKEACYLALLQQVATSIGDRVTRVLERAPADDEATATQLLLAELAHALTDDPRVVRATFGEAAGISPAVEQQRRSNRRWAAQFIEELWRRYGVVESGHDGGSHHAVHRVAVGVVGGLFDLVADWLHDADPEDPDREALVDDLTAFYGTVRRGL